MKKTLTALLCAALALLTLPGCSLLSRALKRVRATPPPQATIEQRTPAPAETEAAYESSAPPRTEAPRAEEPWTKPPAPISGNRSGIPRPELMEFFRQVVFAGGSQLASKWTGPIAVSLSGDYDEQDSAQLTGLLDLFNSYDGFPRATLAAAGEDANMKVRFVTADTLAKEQPKWSGKTCCYSSYWYDDASRIYDATVYVVPSMEQSRANQACDLAWGVFYAMGLCGNTDMYYDSLFNPGYYGDALGSVFQGPCRADWYLVSFLYSRSVVPGMTYEQAAAALAS